MAQSSAKIILGIDPGTLIMGYGLIKINANKASLISLGAVKLTSKTDAYSRLLYIHEKITELINTHKPTHFAIEAPFYGKNVQSMLKLGRAQGVAIAAAMSHGLEVTEFSPKRIKQSITGNGNAAKDQVMKMLQMMLKFEESPRYLDATDALAAAMCLHVETQSPIPKPVTGKRSKSWGDFVKANPGRVD